MNKPPTYLVPTRKQECKPGNPEATHIPHNNDDDDDAASLSFESVIKGITTK